MSERVLFPRGTRLSVTDTISDLQTNATYNLDRRLKSLIQEFGIVTRLVSGLTPDSDLRIIVNPINPSGSVLCEAGVALINENDFGDETNEVYFIYNPQVSNPINISMLENTYHVFAIFSGIQHTNAAVTNGFFYDGVTPVTPTRESDSFYFYVTGDDNYDPAGTGVILADAVRSGLTLSITDRRNENVLTLRNSVIDEDLIFKKDRNNIIEGATTFQGWCETQSGLFVTSISARAGLDIPVIIPAGQDFIVEDISEVDLLNIDEATGLVTIANTLRTTDLLVSNTADIVILTVTGLTVTTATVTDLILSTLTTSDTGTNIRLPGVRNYPFSVGVGVVGTWANPLEGLEVMTVDPANPVPVALNFQTGVEDADELESDPEYEFLSGSPSLNSTNNQGGSEPTNSVTTAAISAWIKAYFGDYGTGGQPDGTYIYTINPNPYWIAEQWVGQILSVYNGATLVGNYLISGNTQNSLILTEGAGYTAAPAVGARYFIGPNAYEYQWKIAPLQPNTGNPHIFGGGGWGPEGSQSPFIEEADIITTSVSADSPVKQLQLFHNLKPGVRYGIKVRSKSQTGEYSAWSDGGGHDGWLEVVAGLLNEISMGPVSATPIMAGIRLSWARAQNPNTKEYARGYQLVWTDDSEAPDFSNSGHPHAITSATTFDIRTRPGRLVKVRVRAFNRATRLSSNHAYVEQNAGGSETQQDVKVLTYRVNFDGTENTQELRTIDSHAFPTSVIVKDLQCYLNAWNVVDPVDQWAKFRIYAGQASNGFELLTEGLGYAVQHGNLILPGQTNLILDAWDTTEESSRTGFKGIVKVTYVQIDVLDPQIGNVYGLVNEPNQL